MSFENIIGNEENKTVLTNLIKNKNILHNYLFYGTEGIGKNIFAKEFAKMILCNNISENGTCNRCKSCIEFDSNNNPDFFLIEPDGNSIKVDQIRQMQKSVLEKPVESTKKVYIIDNADTMTKEAQNCILKTLEEPQEYVVIILVVSNINSILATVNSRCTKLFFKELDDSEIIKYINNKHGIIEVDKDVLKLCNGSIAKVEHVLNRADLFRDVKNIIMKIEGCSELDFLQNSQIIYDNRDYIDYILEYIYILLFERITKESVNVNGYINSMEMVEKSRFKLANSNNFDMTIDNLLMSMWEEINEKNYRG